MQRLQWWQKISNALPSNIKTTYFQTYVFRTYNLAPNFYSLKSDILWLLSPEDMLDNLSGLSPQQQKHWKLHIR